MYYHRAVFWDHCWLVYTSKVYRSLQHTPWFYLQSIVLQSNNNKESVINRSLTSIIDWFLFATILCQFNIQSFHLLIFQRYAWFASESISRILLNCFTSCIIRWNAHTRLMINIIMSVNYCSPSSEISSTASNALSNTSSW